MSKSLNEIVTVCTNHGYETELELSEDSPPNLESKHLVHVIPGITALLIDADCYLLHEGVLDTKLRVKATTRVEGDTQVLELAYGLNPLPQDKLDLLNKGYQTGPGYSAEESIPITPKGDLGAEKAGFNWGQLGGTVTIENTEDPIYQVKNTVTLPLVPPSL